MTRTMISGMTLVFFVVVAIDAQAAQVSRDDFQVETTASLVALCSAGESDPLYTAARNFCHGFAVGSYRMVVIEEAAAKSKRKMYCMPANPPTRDQAIANFTQWASTRPKTMASPPTEGIVEYLVTQFPCK